jgi:hypothetical protein
MQRQQERAHRARVRSEELKTTLLMQRHQEELTELVRV